MTRGERPGPPADGEEPAKQRRLSAEEAARLITEARERGEPIEPIAKRLALGVVDEVMSTLDDAEDRREPRDRR